MSPEVRVRDEDEQQAGLAHGGVYASIAEWMASLATALAVEEGDPAMGLSYNTSFLRPATVGAGSGREEAMARTSIDRAIATRSQLASLDRMEWPGPGAR